MSEDRRLSPWPRPQLAAPPRGEPCTVELDGQTVRAFTGEPLAVALYAAGVRLLGRSPKYHRPRGAFCLEGHCSSCHLRVDGKPNIRSCTIAVRPGLRAQRQNAFPDPEMDLLRAADWMFPEGMDHHTLMTGSRIGNELFVKLVRQMGGTGLLPDEPAAGPLPGGALAVDVCVVGAGPAGLSAAAAAGRAGARVVVFDEGGAPGGSLWAEPGGAARVDVLVGEARAAGVDLRARATAIAFYPEDLGPDGAPGVLAIAAPEGLVRVSARRFVYATGAYDQNLAFPGNDRPGVLSARACGRLAFRHGVRPGRAVTIVVDPQRPFAYAERLLRGLHELDIPATLRPFTEATATSGALRKDAIAVASLPAPAFELPRQHGLAVRFDAVGGGFVPGTDPSGCVATAGDVNGFQGPEAAAREGARVGAEVAAALGAAMLCR